jgi:hypothetical protein
MPATRIRLAVSGTYSSGKTTTTEALSVATGIPRTDALTAREIVVDLLPRKRFQELSAAELLMLGLRLEQPLRLRREVARALDPPEVERMARLGLLEHGEGSLRLSERGRFLANDVVACILR